MSPAGAGIAHFRDGPRPGQLIGPALVVAAVGLVLLLSGGSPARAHAAAPPVAALSPAWAEFQGDCVAGPSAGQGNPGSACVCWEEHLQAEAIVPGYAVDALDAAQVGGGAAYTVGENLSGGPVGEAMAGCGLYAASQA